MERKGPLELRTEKELYIRRNMNLYLVNCVGESVKSRIRLAHIVLLEQTTAFDAFEICMYSGCSCNLSQSLEKVKG